MIPEEYILLPLQNFSYAFNVGWAELAVIPAKAGTQEVPHLLGFASSTQPTVFSFSHQNIIHRITGNLNLKRFGYIRPYFKFSTGRHRLKLPFRRR